MHASRAVISGNTLHALETGCALRTNITRQALWANIAGHTLRTNVTLQTGRQFYWIPLILAALLAAWEAGLVIAGLFSVRRRAGSTP